MSKAENTSQQSRHNHKRFYETYYATWNNRRRGGLVLLHWQHLEVCLPTHCNQSNPRLARQILMVDSKTKLYYWRDLWHWQDNGGGFRP